MAADAYAEGYHDAERDERERIAQAIEAEGQRVADGGFPVAAFDYEVAARIARDATGR